MAQIVQHVLCLIVFAFLAWFTWQGVGQFDGPLGGVSLLASLFFGFVTVLGTLALPFVLVCVLEDARAERIAREGRRYLD